MHRGPSLCLAMLIAATATAQIPAAIPGTSPQESAASEGSPAQAAAVPPKTPTIQTRTNLVVVDVVVTDHSGKNVHGLQRSDFAVTENGVAQHIRSFDEHIAPAQPLTLQPAVDLPPGVFTNYTPIPHSSALNILLLDTLNTPLRDQGFVRDQLLRYIRSAPPTNRIAIFGLTTHLIYLQGFTSDPALLRAAVDKKSVRASKLLSNPTTGGPGPQLSNTLSASGGQELVGVISRLRQFEAETQSFQVQLRTRYTLDAMNSLAHYLSGLPGRKNLIWFSGSFPVSVLPDGNLPDPFAAAADLSDELRETTTLLTRSQVAVYPVDARGLFNVPAYDPSERGSIGPQSFNQQLSDFSQQTILEHSTMRTIAEQTGGHAFLNTNGLEQAVASAISTGANFYTITYSPTDTHWNNAYRRIGLRLGGLPSQQNLTLSYRRGYFAVDPSPRAVAAHPVPRSGSGPSPSPRSPSPLRTAMMRGAPDSTAIILKARVLPANSPSAPPEKTADPGTSLNSDPKIAHGPWRNYTVDISASPGQLLSPNPDGSYSGIDEFVLHCYDSNGVLVTATSQSFRLALSAADVRSAAGAGAPVHLRISVPDRGEFFLRIGVHNLLNDRVGSLEVPLSSIKNLPPSPSSPAAPAAVMLPSP